MKASSVITPIRRLEGITYGVIDEPEGIRDFINTEVRKEWEQGVKEMAGDRGHRRLLPLHHAQGDGRPKALRICAGL